MLGEDKVCTERMSVDVLLLLVILTTGCFDPGSSDRLQHGLQQTIEGSSGISKMNGGSYVGGETHVQHSWRGSEFASLRPIYLHQHSPDKLRSDSAWMQK